MKNNSSSRIIAAEDLGGAAVVWKLGALGGAAPHNHGLTPREIAEQALRRAQQGHAPRVDPATAAAQELEQKLEAARAAGRAEGAAQAEAVLREEYNARERLLAPIVEHARHSVEILDERVAQNVLTLAMAIAGQIVRAELAVDPRHFVALVHEGLAMISETVARIAVHVNPADADLVRSDIGSYDPRVIVVEDAAVASGGCRFQTAHGNIDATLESRIRAIALPLGLKTAGAPADAKASERAPRVGEDHGDHDAA